MVAAPKITASSQRRRRRKEVESNTGAWRGIIERRQFGALFQRLAGSSFSISALDGKEVALSAFLRGPRGFGRPVLQDVCGTTDPQVKPFRCPSPREVRQLR